MKAPLVYANSYNAVRVEYCQNEEYGDCLNFTVWDGKKGSVHFTLDHSQVDALHKLLYHREVKSP